MSIQLKRLDRTRARRLAATALSAVAILLSGGPLAADFGDPVRGQTLFVEKGCVSCHAVRGSGGRVGPDLGRTPAKGSFYEITARMWNHTGMMGEKMEELRIPRAEFEGDELADLVAFLYFLNYFDEPGDPRTGKILFTEKHCVQCHRLSGEGGASGPALDTLPRGISPLRIAQDLWNHGPAMIDSIKRRGLSVPVFNEGEIVDLFAYLRSQGQRQATREFQSAGDPGRGQVLFESKGCPRCHEVFGEPSIGPDLGTSELRGSVTQLAGRMWNHWPDMIEAMEALDMPLPEFKGEELAQLFAYIFISRYDGEPGDSKTGQALYYDKGCAACHGWEGEGGPTGTALRDKTPGESKEAIVRMMWNHAPQMWLQMDSRELEWPRMSAEELAHLLAFLTEGWPESAAGAAGSEASQ